VPGGVTYWGRGRGQLNGMELENKRRTKKNLRKKKEGSVYAKRGVSRYWGSTLWGGKVWKTHVTEKASGRGGLNKIFSPKE